MRKFIYGVVTILSLLGFQACSLISPESSCEPKPCSKGKPIIIAHRGASSYLPEHTLESKAMAYALGADYIEQDVDLTKDDQIVVAHDPYLGTISNVQELYPDRIEKDGKYHIRDFNLDEIKKLTLHERTNTKTGEAVYKDRFPNTTAIPFRMPTLREELELIKGLNKSTGKDVGIYVELKNPSIYKDHGKKFAKLTLELLAEYGYTNEDSKCFIQCFDPFLLKYIKYDLKSKLRLIQLIAHNEWAETPGIDYNEMLTNKGLKEISTYAYGIGPSIDQLFVNYSAGDLKLNNVVKWAHEYGLKIHPYTLRADDLPKGLTYEQVMKVLLTEAKVDGLFTDFTDLGVKYRNKYCGQKN